MGKDQRTAVSSGDAGISISHANLLQQSFATILSSLRNPNVFVRNAVQDSCNFDHGNCSTFFGFWRERSISGSPTKVIDRQETAKYHSIAVIEDGIERIRYIPHAKKHEAPIVLIHGMWHGAWCWKYWQEKLAEKGWESVSISLPGHGQSPEQRPIAECTLGYYLYFLKEEIARHKVQPIIFGHSMGGALLQWYLKHVGDIKAAVFVASWTQH